jgi:type II secretory pathway component PulM
MAMMILAAVIGSALYWWMVQSGSRAHRQLSASVATLRAQVALLPQQAAEIEHLRATPAKSRTAEAQTDLRALVEAQAGAAGLTRALVKIDAPDANQVVVVFGAVAFADWLKWVDELKARQIRLDNCRIEALTTPGMVSVTATLLRTGHS